MREQGIGRGGHLDDEVRPISSADIPALAELHRRAFAGYVGAEAGPRYLRAFFAWYLRYEGSINLCIGEPGKPVGYVFGGPFGFSKRLNRDLFPEILRAALTHPRLIMRPGIGVQIRIRFRALILGRENRLAEKEFGPETFCLVGIGTDPDWRGRGVATRLLEEFTVRAFDRGFERAMLDVYKRNEGAIRLYESHGWRRVLDHGTVLTFVRTNPRLSSRTGAVSDSQTEQGR
ncbi:MAG: GNAT family N-acetyltransferase [Acidobacteria bacterium]|nr:GNAT family N-acetyltransferase [Acidobacteriota bacterium]